ncbi:MAG: S-methyl-5-thioribose-1-phosphate isomerase [Actinobacteria bacterium]|nr:MAG: S-methyl-5-thioribose-1-phosphate isomerase [Actinomycetota bacterium]RIK07288.1 MAG: S-methyl-5-thioribose-1-phosphate isomerase [Acidobacteriota bacterium]
MVKTRLDDPIPPTIEWLGDSVRLIDQRLLPTEVVLVEAHRVSELCELIRSMAIRGAPALGAAGAMGIALAVVRGEDISEAGRDLISTRPTAVNLAWGVERASSAADPVREAVLIAEGDVEANRRLGAHGAGLIPHQGRVLTHCNAGALACVGYGTALGVIRAAAEAGRNPSVWVDETRPLLQGARLTAWELSQLEIPCTLIADVAAGSLMAAGLVDVVVVGADRIAANGDVANKIGTYPLAVLAARHGIPFVVAAPCSTIDRDTATGSAIPVEHRDPVEVSEVAGTAIAPAGVSAHNPAFDVTPAELIGAYVTETGVWEERPPI